MRRALLGVAMLSACGGGGSSEPSWELVADAQPAALLSVWGSSESDVWAVGGDPRDGTGPLVFHYDGTGWTKLDSGQRNVDLWWVRGFAGGPVYMSGSAGTILRYQNGAFEKMATPPRTTIVFGMWGATANDMWAVGGTFGGGAFVWNYDGGPMWTERTDVPATITTQDTCWKVGGRAADDVWISGTSGKLLHWNGMMLEPSSVPTEASLFSVAGNANRFITVGGGFDGVIFENTGSGWTSAIPTGLPVLSGVAVADTGDAAYAVGHNGTIFTRSADGWKSDSNGITDQNLHAAWIDPKGGVWAVGGNFDTQPTKAGVLVHKGDTLAGSFP